jgi:hypothetical protein
MRIFPLVRSDYHLGWAKSRLVEAVPTGRLAPDHPVPASDRGGQDAIIPAFLIPNPVTGKRVAPPSGKRLVAIAPLTGAAPPAASRAPMGLAELSRRLAVSKAYDGVENVSTAYGDFLDDFQSPQFSALLAKDGFKVSAFAGYYIGRDRVTQAGLLVWGKPPVTRASSR